MQEEPQVVERVAQPYVAVRSVITMETFAQIADRFPEVFGWMAARAIQPVDAPFFRYNLIDMAGDLEVEAGVPIDPAAAGDADVFAGILPAGKYVTVTHTGHPDELVDVTGQLLEWAATKGLKWDMTHAEAGEQWGCRVEFLQTNPSVEPDMTKWRTQLAFRLA